MLTCNHSLRKSIRRNIAKLEMPTLALSHICVEALDDLMLMMLSRADKSRGPLTDLGSAT